MMTEGFESYVKDLFNNQAYSDVTIVVDDDVDAKGTPTGTVSIPAHRLVLATMSDYFRTMLYGQFVEANQSEIRLIGVPNSTFQQCLRFIYFGWDATLDDMSLDEGIKFYSLARMLLMDTKLKQSYSEWIVANIVEWEDQLWKIFTTAIENDLPLVVKRSEEVFSDVAIEFLMSDAFLTVPLTVVRNVISCKKMNCAKKILIDAIKRWITSNETDDATKSDLLKSVQSKKAPFFKANKVRLYQDWELEHSKHYIMVGFHYYSSHISFDRCMILAGVTVAFEREHNSQITKGDKELTLEIILESEPLSILAVNKTTTVTYDLTKRRTDEVAIFFPSIKVCQGTDGCTFNFSWPGAEAEPFLHLFRPSSRSFATTPASFVMSIYKSSASEKGHPFCDSCRHRRTMAAST